VNSIPENRWVLTYQKKKLVEGHPAEEIIKEAKENDLIVIGSKGKTGLDRLLLGSVAENVARHASCPVMIVQ
jgi:nucleotide-binding universal stress UspA family protein